MIFEYLVKLIAPVISLLSKLIYSQRICLNNNNKERHRVLFSCSVKGTIVCQFFYKKQKYGDSFLCVYDQCPLCSNVSCALWFHIAGDPLISWVHCRVIRPRQNAVTTLLQCQNNPRRPGMTCYFMRCARGFRVTGWMHI